MSWVWQSRKSKENNFSVPEQIMPLSVERKSHIDRPTLVTAERRIFQIEFIPLYNGQTPHDFAIRQLMGLTKSTCDVADWSKADNSGSGVLWFDHGISTWMTAATQ
eukprot:6206994-Amphidinium_carterae.1